MATMTKKDKKDADLAEVKASLLKMIKPTSQVYAIVKRVAASGMSRRIVILIVDKGEIRNISGYVSTLLGLRWNDDGSVTIGGAGMDMGFHIVYSMSRVLWPDGFECVGEHCRSNDHTNGSMAGRQGHCAVCGKEREGAAHYTSHGRPVCSKDCAGKPLPVHGDGGYALIHRSL